jgi:hypothetical protein
LHAHPYACFAWLVEKPIPSRRRQIIAKVDSLIQAFQRNIVPAVLGA